jgi:hypothetical protein
MAGLLRAAYGPGSIAQPALSRRLDGAASDAAGATAGGIVLTGPTGHIYGFFRYRLQRSDAGRRVLALDDFCALPPVGRRAATACLLGAAERIAAAQGCTGLCLRPIEETTHHAAPPSPYEVLVESGFLAGPVFWQKDLE